MAQYSVRTAQVETNTTLAVYPADLSCSLRGPLAFSHEALLFGQEQLAAGGGSLLNGPNLKNQKHPSMNLFGGPERGVLSVPHLPVPLPPRRKVNQNTRLNTPNLELGNPAVAKSLICGSSFLPFFLGGELYYSGEEMKKTRNSASELFLFRGIAKGTCTDIRHRAAMWLHPHLGNQPLWLSR